MSADNPKHIEEFNTLVGLIFAQLYEQFPLAHDLDEPALARAMGILGEPDPVVGADYLPANLELPSGRRFEALLVGARAWLHEEGFIRANGDWSHCDLVLTSKAFSVMNATPAGVTAGKSIGAQLTEAATSATRSASNAAIGDLVGQVIGFGVGVAKGLF